jgi:hypothetical protein
MYEMGVTEVGLILPLRSENSMQGMINSKQTKNTQLILLKREENY